MEFLRVLGVSGIIVAFSIAMLSALFLSLWFFSGKKGRVERVSFDLKLGAGVAVCMLYCCLCIFSMFRNVTIVVRAMWMIHDVLAK